MKNLKVWIKLGIGFGIVLSLMCALGLLAIWEFNVQRKAASTISDAYMPELILAVRFERAAQGTVQNMLRFVDSGDEQYYSAARAQMDELVKASSESNALVAHYPYLHQLSTNLKEAQRSFTAYEGAVEKTRTLVLALNARSQKLQTSANAFFSTLNETLILAETQLETLIKNSMPQEEILERLKNTQRINRCIDLGNDMQRANMGAQSAGDPDIAFKALDQFTPMFKTLEEMSANALPQNRERAAKVIATATTYREEFTGMINDWRELKNVSVERTALVEQLLTNAQNTASVGILRVQQLCGEAKVASEESISVLSAGLGIGIALGLLLSWFLTRIITSPLNQTVTFATQVAAGNLDERLVVEQRDEIGKLADALNSMVKTLIQRIKAANTATEEANLRKEEATVAMKQADEARQLAEQAKRQGQLDAAVQLEGVVARVSAASEHLAAQVEQSSCGAQEQAARMGETATAMEEMNVSVIEVAHNTSVTAEVSGQAREKAVAGATEVNRVVDGMSRINTGAMELRKDMEILSDKAESIGSILNVISDIADQTNLLALNAAIEAARAGEAGRGFAVVADEVRKLAEKTMQATSEVGQAIRGIQEGAAMNMTKVESTVEIVNEVAGLATHSGQALSEIVSLVDQASEQVRAIAAASEEQSATSEHISHAVSDVNRIASETATTMAESGRAVSELSDQASALNRLIENLKRG